MGIRDSGGSAIRAGFEAVGVDGFVGEVARAILVVGTAVGVLPGFGFVGALVLVEAPALLVGVLGGEAAGVLPRPRGSEGGVVGLSAMGSLLLGVIAGV